MRRLTRFSIAVASIVALAGGAAGEAAASPHAARKPVVIKPSWTKISQDIGFGFASAGVLRTGDGRLHVVWPEDVKNVDSLHYSTVGSRAKLLSTGTIVSHWAAISQFPRLVLAPHGLGQPSMRVIFDGADGKGGSPYNLGTFYSATASSAGKSWTLMAGSLSRSESPPLTDDAATVLPNGQPVTAWSSVDALSYHLGVDPAVPAATPDVQIPLGPSGGLIDPTLVTNGGGQAWGAWFNSSGTDTMGYWADPIFTGTAGMVKAPGSGGKNLNNSQPEQPVAFAVRDGGGEYMAYCVPTKTLTCGHIALWRVGASKAITVAGSNGPQESKVALAAAPGGHLWVLWYSYRSNVIRVVRTNAAATRFGPVQTLAPPPHLFSFQGLQAEGSSGPLDIIALETQTGAQSSPAFFSAQILPPLTLRSSKSKAGVGTKVTFTVTDAGNPVGGAAVVFAGSTAFTDAKGVAYITVKKGTKVGKHTAAAGKPGYSPARVTITVT